MKRIEDTLNDAYIVSMGDLNLPYSLVMVFREILGDMRANEDTQTTLKIGDIMQRLDLSEWQVKRRVEDLTQKGYIKVEKMKAKRDGRKKRYIISLTDRAHETD